MLAGGLLRILRSERGASGVRFGHLRRAERHVCCGKTGDVCYPRSPTIPLRQDLGAGSFPAELLNQTRPLLDLPLPATSSPQSKETEKLIRKNDKLVQENLGVPACEEWWKPQLALSGAYAALITARGEALRCLRCRPNSPSSARWEMPLVIRIIGACARVS